MEVKLESDAFPLDIKEEPLDIGEDTTQLHHDRSSLMIDATAIKSERGTHQEAMDSHVGCEIFDERKTKSDNLKEDQKENRNRQLQNWKKKFECELCKKIFYRKTHLRSHMLTHSVNKLFTIFPLQKIGLSPDTPPTLLSSTVHHPIEVPAEVAPRRTGKNNDTLQMFKSIVQQQSLHNAELLAINHKVATSLNKVASSYREVAIALGNMAEAIIFMGNSMNNSRFTPK